jgi:hypothetical protein
VLFGVALLGVGVESRGREGECLDTLLGPEGSSVCCLILRVGPLGPILTCLLAPVLGWCVGRVAWWCRPYLENYTVDASIFVARQATKGTWWMPWHQEPMKDVEACDKPRGIGNRVLIRGFPNGETQLESCPVTRI